MTTQPEALALADELEKYVDANTAELAAAELRRLYAENEHAWVQNRHMEERIEQLQVTNQELLEALKALVQDSQHAEHDCGDRDCPVLKARALITKAEGRA